MSGNVEAQAKRFYPKLWSADNLKALVEKGKLSAGAYWRITGDTCADKGSVVAHLGSRPNKSGLIEAANALGIAVPEGMTNPEIWELIEAA